MNDKYRYLYKPLSERSLKNFQVQYLARNYDFGKQSRVAALIVKEVNARMGGLERQLGIQRVRPFHLYLKWKGVNLALPLFHEDYLGPLLSGNGDFRDSRELVFLNCQRITRRAQVKIDHTQLRGVVDPYFFVRHFRRKRINKTDNCVASLPNSCCDGGLRKLIESLKPLSPFDRIDALDTGAPVSFVAELSRFVEQEGRLGPVVANHLVEELITLRNICCPRVRHLKNGEMPLLATSVYAHLSEEVATKFRRLSPVILTVWTKEELDHCLWKEIITDQLLQRRIIRVCFEAYRQNGLLSLMDLQWIFQISSRKVGELLRSAQREYSLIIPTPGTILDAGRSMTHKDIIINLYLQGHTVKEIAKQTYHSPRAVDNYIDTFESVLIMSLYGIPKRLMARILQKGITLIKEHLDLVKQYFHNREEIRHFITGRKEVNF